MGRARRKTRPSSRVMANRIITLHRRQRHSPAARVRATQGRAGTPCRRDGGSSGIEHATNPSTDARCPYLRMSGVNRKPPDGNVNAVAGCAAERTTSAAAEAEYRADLLALDASTRSPGQTAAADKAADSWAKV